MPVFNFERLPIEYENFCNRIINNYFADDIIRVKLKPGNKFTSLLITNSTRNRRVKLFVPVSNNEQKIIISVSKSQPHRASHVGITPDYDEVRTEYDNYKHLMSCDADLGAISEHLYSGQIEHIKEGKVKAYERRDQVTDDTVVYACEITCSEPVYVSIENKVNARLFLANKEVVYKLLNEYAYANLFNNENNQTFFYVENITGKHDVISAVRFNHLYEYVI